MSRRSFPPFLVLGHLVNDMLSFMISGLLPVFMVLFNLSYFLAGVIAMVFNITSSLVQPLLGRWFDRTQAVWLLEAGLVLNCLGMSLVGLSPNYTILLFLIGTAGLGAAAFHPPAFAAVLRFSGPSKGSAMGLFIAGGNVGTFLAPMLTGFLMSVLGPPGTLVMLPIGLITVALMFRMHFKQEARSVEVRLTRPANTRLLFLLVIITVFRSIAIYGGINFLPLYFVKVGDSLVLATALTSLWLGLGVLGQFGGGLLSDRIGGRPVVVWSLLFGGLFFYGFLVTNGFFSLILFAASGAMLYASWPVMMVMSSQAAPDNVGAVSGLMLGFSVGVGGLASVAIGVVGDMLGLGYAFYFIAAVGLLGGLVALFLPRRI